MPRTISPGVVAEVAPNELPKELPAPWLMRVYLQRAGYSLQLDGRTTRPADDKRKAYFEAVINEWQAFQANGYHTFDAEGYQALLQTLLIR